MSSGTVTRVFISRKASATFSSVVFFMFGQTSVSETGRIVFSGFRIAAEDRPHAESTLHVVGRHAGGVEARIEPLRVEDGRPFAARRELTNLIDNLRLSVGARRLLNRLPPAVPTTSFPPQGEKNPG